MPLLFFVVFISKMFLSTTCVKESNQYLFYLKKKLKKLLTQNFSHFPSKTFRTNINTTNDVKKKEDNKII